MPKRCLGCRGLEGVAEGELRKQVEWLVERAEAEQRALTGMGVCLPGVWGEGCRGVVGGLGSRVEGVREGLKKDIEGLRRRYEEGARRERW